MRYLDRFVEAHEKGDPAPYAVALTEIRRGRKYEHWMWYIFPQLRDLGRSSRAYIYGIVDLAEAKAYLADAYLGGHLREITEVLLQLEETDPVAIFGDIDGKKLCSSMTLFAFTTLIGNYSYCEGCLTFILNKKPSKTGLFIFRILATVLVFIGAISGADLVWNMADMTQGFMVIINMPVILLLMKPAMDCLKDYCRQKKEGMDPTFHAKDININEELDFWQ